MRDKLIDYLRLQGQTELATAVIQGTQNSLSPAQKDMLRFSAFQLRKEAARRVQDALVEVSASGWGREKDTTTPGLIQPLMAL
jgi:hypothetical protein